MSKTKTETRWKEKLLEWQASGKSISVWCSEHQIPVTTFYGWKNRLKKLSSKQHQTVSESHQRLQMPQGFVELRDKKPSESGIMLELGGVKIHLLSSFDPCTLNQCIACLRGATC